MSARVHEWKTTEEVSWELDEEESQPVGGAEAAANDSAARGQPPDVAAEDQGGGPTAEAMSAAVRRDSALEALEADLEWLRQDNPDQTAVIELLHRALSLADTARKLGIPRTTASKRRDAAFKKLETRLVMRLGRDALQALRDENGKPHPLVQLADTIQLNGVRRINKGKRLLSNGWDAASAEEGLAFIPADRAAGSQSKAVLATRARAERLYGRYRPTALTLEHPEGATPKLASLAD